MSTLPDSLRFEAEAKRLWLAIPSRAEKFEEGERIIERALREAAAKALEWADYQYRTAVDNQMAAQSTGKAIRALRTEGTKEGG